MDSIQVFGKSTCKTTQKVVDWFNSNKINIEYIDIISSPPSKAFLDSNVASDNIKPFLNSRSKIYRENNMSSELPGKNEAIKMMLEDPNLIKRPVVVTSSGNMFGFDEDFLKSL